MLWSARIFFLEMCWAGHFFPLPNSLQDSYFPLRLSAGFFFPPKGSVQVFYKMYLHLHCGYCSNSPDMKLQSNKLSKLCNP